MSSEERIAWIKKYLNKVHTIKSREVEEEGKKTKKMKEVKSFTFFEKWKWCRGHKGTFKEEWES